VHCSDERGVTLLESVLALGLASVVLLGVMSGMATTLSVSARTAADTAANAALVSLSESLKGRPYLPCASPAELQSEWASQQVRYGNRRIRVRVDAVRYWDPRPDQQRFSEVCANPDGGAQLVSLSVTSGSGRATGSVVLRNPRRGS
jgi:type II secretory pathway pseudopilin PulG